MSLRTVVECADDPDTAAVGELAACLSSVTAHLRSVQYHVLANRCIYADHVSGSFDDQHAGVQGFNGLIDTQEGHQVSVTGLDKLRSSPLASVLSRGLDARTVEHSPLGTSFSCSNACMEQLFKVLLASHSLAH